MADNAKTADVQDGGGYVEDISGVTGATVQPPAASTGKTAVLFISTGSPAAPTAESVRDYLEAYLTDKRLVDIPRAKWYPILYGIILPKRSPRMASRYEAIWTDDGSPLSVYTDAQVAGLRQALIDRGHGDVGVSVAYRYATPTIEEEVYRLVQGEHVDHLVIVTCYPQYASVTNGTMYQEVFAALSHLKRIPSVSTIDSYYDEPHYLDAVAARIRETWEFEPDGKHALVFTYHSTLVADMEAGDVYEAQTKATARKLAERLGVPEDFYAVGYQSVFDKNRPWLGPQTQTELLPRLAEEGKTDVCVVAPGFTADCLETHYDIDQDQRQTWGELVPGGKFTYVSCVNDDPGYIACLADLVEAKL